MSTTIHQWNARSVVAHHSFLKRHINTSATIPDVICIQETFLHDQLRFAMENYNIERLDRPAGAHGGFGTLITTGISYCVLNNPSNMEALIVCLKLSIGDLTVVNVYHRSTDNIPDDIINDYRKLFNAYNRSSIILGDFNADSADDRGRLLEELIEEHNLVVLNTGAGTFVRPFGEMSHLDIAMVSANISRIANWTVMDDALGIDHLPIVITVKNPAVVEECSQPHWI